ncbi:SRPBCC family protein [Micromonospora sp. NPDC004551]|uniref:SRPBCC family protein n=1 Tax=Micromonospora sp. NPDC004551 TaxID=3154284 RepID=UPI0033AC9991
MTAEIRNDVIVATEHIKAPPEVVFPYLTDPALIVRWIGDKAELDPQPGGVFSLDMGDVAARGVYLTVEPPYRVVFTWGIPGNDALPPGGSTVEIVLTPDGDDTMVVLTHRGVPPTLLDTHRAGWEDRLGRLSLAAAG